MADILQSTPGPRFDRPKLDWAWTLILLSPLIWYFLLQAGYELYDVHAHRGIGGAGSHAGHAHTPPVITQPRFVLNSLIYIAPYFAFAVAIGAYAVASDAAELVNRAFRYNQPVAIGLAAIAGTFSPLCSCGVIPLIAAMLVARVPLAPIMAFWLASPLMAPEQYAITSGALGFEFATTKAVFALIIGAVGGYATYTLSFRLDLSPEQTLREGLLPKSCCGNSNSGPEEKPVRWFFFFEASRRQAFLESAWSTTLFLGKWLLLAFVLEALMLQLNLVGPLVSWLASTGPLAIPLSAFVGIPAYLNGDAAPALVSTFVAQGLPQGAAMAFLIGGGVTCIPAAVAVWSLVRPQVFSLYLAFGLGGAILGGFGAALVL